MIKSSFPNSSIGGMYLGKMGMMQFIHEENSGCCGSHGRPVDKSLLSMLNYQRATMPALCLASHT